MSKNAKNNAPATEEKAEKVMTKYDLKMQRRKEEKEREERAQKLTTAVLVIVLLAVLCLVLSFPIKRYIALNKTFVTIGNENVTEVEFDYCYHTVVNNYVNTYSQYLSWFGLDVNKDLGEQSYSENRTWKDYFEELTVNNMRQNKALKADAAANGFTADVSKECNQLIDQMKANAKEAGVTFSKYLRQTYGQYASENRIKPFLEEALFVAKYQQKLSEDMTPAAEEVQAKYDEAPKDYDSVDYRIVQIDAVLPTEPTDLADPVDETEEKDEDAAYVPSDAEVEKAMADARKEAEAAIDTVAKSGEQVTGILYDSANDVIRDWLFEDARKAGDVTVLEDKDSNKVYCVAFEKRYRDEAATARTRIMIMDTEEEAREAYGAWQQAGASDSAFEDLCNGTYLKYAAADGGLVEGLTNGEDLYEELVNWLFADGRQGGDCEVINVPDVAWFVVYYIGEGQPKWYNTIESDLRSTAVSEYVDKLTEACTVSDPDKNLNYLVLEAEEKKAAEESAAAESAEGQEAEDGASEDAEENSQEE